MDSSSRCSVIIIGAGISGISAAKVLSENGVDDLVILEASDRIGGRIRKEDFAGLSVELGAGWIAGVGGKESNPVWELASKFGLRTCFSDYSNARFNIYDQKGKIFPSGLAAASYNKAVNSAIQELSNQQATLCGLSTAPEPPSSPKTPIDLAIDFILHDFEMAEVEPISTYTEFGEREFLVADERGYEFLLYKIAETFLFTSEGKIVDSRLKLNKVVRELQHSRNGVTVKTEDGSVYEANYVILSVSVGVLQSDLISFRPPLPKWKTEAIMKCDVIVYTKIFLKFPHKFWPCGPGTEFFIYAHERRGYYTFWQHMENAYPGSNILVVTLTNGESKRVESQSDEKTMEEVMGVLRDMFGPDIPNATQILVPRWWNNRFQRGSYSNYPIFSTKKDFNDIKSASFPRVHGLDFRIEILSSSWACPVRHKPLILGVDTHPKVCNAPAPLDMHSALVLFERIWILDFAVFTECFQAPVGPIFFSGEHTNERFSGYVHGGYLSGIDTSKALLEEMRKDDERKEEKESSLELVESQKFLLEPFLALTESLTLTQQETVSRLHKWENARQLFASGKLVVREPIK